MPAFFLKRYFGGLVCAPIFAAHSGGLAQLARALAWHARGHRFDSVILHFKKKVHIL